MAKARTMTPLRIKTRRTQLGWLACAAGAVLAAAAGCATANAGSSIPNTGKPAPAPQHCQTAQCTSAARAARARGFPPASTTVPPVSSWPSESSVVASARMQAQAPDGQQLAPAAAAALPVEIKKMTIHEFNVSQHIADDADISPDRIVWVVTVHGHYVNADVPYGHKPIVVNVYTDVIDAATGTLIIQALGPIASLP